MNNFYEIIKLIEIHRMKLVNEFRVRQNRHRLKGIKMRWVQNKISIKRE